MSVFTAKTITLPDGAEVLLRSPELDDAPRLIEYLDIVRRETEFLYWSPDDDLPDTTKERDWIASRRDEVGGLTIVAEADGQIVSICGIDREGPQQRIRHNALLGISILGAWCDRGLGTVLMAELIGWAEACPELDVVWLGVCDGNERAVSLYRKLGFELTGRRPSRVKFKDRYCDELTMSRWIGSAELVT